MKKSIKDSILNLNSITISQLQQQLHHHKHNRHNKHNSTDMSKHNKNIVIKSPFYQRTNHKPDCTCVYHKRIKYQPNNVRRLKTQPNEEIIRNTIAHQPDQHMELNDEHLYHQIMKEIMDNQGNCSDNYKKYYFEYLKTLTQYKKFNKLNKLDCHNQLFQEILKSRYLINSEQTKSDQKMQPNNSQKLMKETQTENSINCIQNIEKKYNFGGSSKETAWNTKKVMFRETDKTLELISEQSVCGKQIEIKKKKARFGQHRSSFFGLLEDQQILKQLCVKFMDNNNTSLIRQGQLIVKKLASLDSNFYKQVIEQMQEDILTEMVKVKNLSNEQVDILIKIVLKKIKDETKAFKQNSSEQYRKNSLIDELCSKYGWMQSDQVMQLKNFWDLRQQKKKDERRRSSVFNTNKQFKSRGKIIDKQPRSKNKHLQRQYTQIKSEKSNKSIKSNQAINEDEQLKLTKSNFYKKQTILIQKNIIQQAKSEQFKLYSPFASMKKLNKSSHKILKCKFLQDEKDNNNNNNNTNNNKQQKSLNVFNEDAYDEQNKKKSDFLLPWKKREEEENDKKQSIFVYLRNQVLNHMQVHKHFVKKIQHFLTESNCETIIIGFGQSLITKRRKIRAIQQILKDNQFAQCDQAKHLEKYIKIFDEYCDLVISKNNNNFYKNLKKKKNENENITIDSDQKETQAVQQKVKQNQMSALFQEMMKDRELKFLDIHYLHEKQDPKEQLIIRIPQYTTRKEKGKLKLDHSNNKYPNNDKILEETMLEKHKNSTIGQKQMGQKVNLIFQDLKYKQQCSLLLDKLKENKKQHILNDKLTKLVDNYRKKGYNNS